MPNSPLGHELAAAVPDPPVTINVSEVLVRARRRARLRTTALGVTAMAAVVSLAVLAGALRPGASHIGPVATKAPSSAPSVDATPTGLLAPNVLGLAVDAAVSALGRAGCAANIGAIVNGSAPVGQVLAQRTIGDLCEVVLTISAGPRSSAPPCTSLTITTGVLGAGLGHVGFPLHFRNNGQVACSLAGYPRVTATDSRSGKPIKAVHTPNGYLGGTNLPVPTYVLGPGEEVSALVEGTDNPVGNATSCSDLTHVTVTVNGRSTTVDQMLANCSGMAVHPYVPGTTGSAQK